MKNNILRITISLFTIFFILSFAIAGDKTYVIRIDNFFGGPIHKVHEEYELRGEIAYLGNNPLMSIRIHYQVNGEEPASELFDNINVNPYVPFRYLVSEKWIPENEGEHEIKIWFTELNGGAPDEGVSDTVSVFVEVYDHLAERQMALLESFSSINCGSCATVTPALRKIVDENDDKFVKIYYHPLHYENSPLYNFNPKDQNIRRDYYDVFYTPWSAIGNLYKGGSEGVEEMLMQLELQKWAGFSLDGNWYVENDSLFITLEGEIFVNTTDKDYRLLIAGIEESVHFDEPPGSNHEKDFYHVMRFFAPDAQGTKLVAEENKTTFSKDFVMPWFESLETENMSLIAFVQEMGTTEISQVLRLEYEAPEDDDGDDATYISGLSEKNPFVVYPNPANQFIRLRGDMNFVTPEQIMVFDLQGRLIKTLQNTYQIDVSDISAGVYYLLIESGNQIFREKISIIR
ncbi:MAG: T9SS C-terminal target domain-containing protein [Bacteroidetes bacterium]|nr:MAG: T9SS C-terminal target domain-containing protein [Bacteroidota bacterium]